MDHIQFLLGIVSMLLGVALVMAAVVSALKHERMWWIHELWLLPPLGFAFMLLGRWLIR